jgi:hypothetical protein
VSTTTAPASAGLNSVLCCTMQAFTTCTLKDLCPEDKQKVAQLVRQVRTVFPATATACKLCAFDSLLHAVCWLPVGGGARQGEPAAQGNSCNGETNCRIAALIAFFEQPQGLPSARLHAGCCLCRGMQCAAVQHATAVCVLAGHNCRGEAASDTGLQQAGCEGELQVRGGYELCNTPAVHIHPCTLITPANRCSYAVSAPCHLATPIYLLLCCVFAA